MRTEISTAAVHRYALSSPQTRVPGRHAPIGPAALSGNDDPRACCQFGLAECYCDNTLAQQDLRQIQSAATVRTSETSGDKRLSNGQVVNVGVAKETGMESTSASPRIMYSMHMRYSKKLPPPVDDSRNDCICIRYRRWPSSAAARCCVAKRHAAAKNKSHGTSPWRSLSAKFGPPGRSSSALFDVPVERRLRAAFAGNIDGLRLIAVLVGRVHRIAAGTQLDQHERAERIGVQHLVVLPGDDPDVDISEKVRPRSDKLHRQRPVASRA